MSDKKTDAAASWLQRFHDSGFDALRYAHPGGAEHGSHRWHAGVWTGPEHDLICVKHCKTNEEAERYLSPGADTPEEALLAALNRLQNHPLARSANGVRLFADAEILRLFADGDGGVIYIPPDMAAELRRLADRVQALEEAAGKGADDGTPRSAAGRAEIGSHP